MKRTCAVMTRAAFLAMCVVAQPDVVRAQSTADRINDFLAAEMEEMAVPGLTASVGHHGEVIYEGPCRVDRQQHIQLSNRDLGPR